MPTIDENELATSGKRVTKGHARNLETRLSTLRQETDKINALLEEGENEDAILTFQRASLQSVIDILPIAQHQYKKNPNMSNAYALNALISQSRELISDIEARQDKSHLAQTISERVIRPAFLDLAQNLMNSTSMLRELISSSAGIDKRTQAEVKAHIDRFLRETARYMQDRHDRLVQQLGEQIGD